MRIHAFRVLPRGAISLSDVIARIDSIPFDQRLRRLGDNIEIRLEDANQVAGNWLLDFAGIRHEGPGRASATLPIEDFDLLDDEGFGHETAAYFDPSAGFMTLQYNHFGPRVGKIQAYLSRFAQMVAGVEEGENEVTGGHGFNFIPVMAQGATERLNHMSVVKKFEVSIYIPGVAANLRGVSQSLSSLLDNPLIGGAEKLKLQISAGRARGRSLSVAGIREAVSDLLGLRDEVFELTVTAREDDDMPTEPLDLLQARLEADIPIPRGGRRYSRDDRWSALRQVFQTWQGNGQFV